MESLILFSEDEDEILAAADDEESEEPHAHHTNNQQHEHNSSYVPSEHFLHFPPEPPMYDPTFGNAFDRDTVVYPPETLFVGQQFNTKEETQDVINRFHIINHCTYKVSSSNQSRLPVRCAHDDCAWRCKVILRTKNQLWEIMKLEGVHTCVSPMISQDHNKLRASNDCKKHS